MTEHEEARRLIRQQLLAAGITDLPDIPDELDSIPPGPILTTLKLNEHLLAWKTKMSALSAEERRRNAKISRHLLTVAYGCAQTMCKSWNGSFALDEPLPISGPLSPRGEGTDQTIILSIFVLIETLKEAIMHATQDWYFEIEDYYPTQPEILIRRFKKARWCPNRILWATNLGVCTSYVLSSSTLGDKADQHEGCTEEVCRLDNVDESTYKTRHVFPSCVDPSFSSESPDSASSIVADGGIPIVYFDGTKLQVVPYTEQESGFTAISHVWSGGLGNVRENALPECQLEQLQRTVDQLNLLKASLNTDSTQSTPENRQFGAYRRPPSGDWDSSYPEAPYMRKFTQGFHVQSKYYFWIDTLCVPLRPADLRRAAVRRITEVFQRAAQVLLIDDKVRLSSPPGRKPKFTVYRVGAPEIIDVPDTSTNEGLLVDLASGNWMRRLWTFSEGALANEIYVELHNGFIFYDQLVWDVFSKHESNICGDGLKRLAEELLLVRKSHKVIRQSFAFTGGLAEDDGLENYAEVIRFPSAQSREFYGRSVDVLTAVTSRKTTKQEDESICIASALDIPLLGIQECVELSQRMRQLLLALEFVPAEILFLAAPKLEGVPGFSWAPSSFMSGGVRTSMSEKPIARVTETGLLHQSHAFAFRSTSPELDPAGLVFKIRDDRNKQVFHVGKIAWGPWNASEQFVTCDSGFLDGSTERWSERVLDAEANGAEICSTFVLFTAAKQIGGRTRSIGAVARVIYDDAVLTEEPRMKQLLIEDEDNIQQSLDADTTARGVVGDTSPSARSSNGVSTRTGAEFKTELRTSAGAANIEERIALAAAFDSEIESAHEQNTNATAGASHDVPESSSPESSARRIPTVKYEFPAFITTHSESEFGTMFTVLEEAQPVADIMNFFFLANQIDDTQLWKVI